MANNKFPTNKNEAQKLYDHALKVKNDYHELYKDVLMRDIEVFNGEENPDTLDYWKIKTDYLRLQEDCENQLKILRQFSKAENADNLR